MQRSSHKRPRVARQKLGSDLDSKSESDSTKDEESSAMHSTDSFPDICSNIIETGHDQMKTAIASVSPNVIQPENNCCALHDNRVNTQFVFHWALQAANKICNALSVFGSCCQPCQIPNNVLSTLSNELMNLMEWFGVNMISKGSFIELSCSSFLLALVNVTSPSIVDEACEPNNSESKKCFLKNDVIVVTNEVFSSPLTNYGGTWINPVYAQCLLKTASNQSQSVNWKVHSSLSTLAFHSFDGYSPFKQKSPHLDTDSIFILGISSMIVNLWCELWGRIHRITNATQEFSTVSQLIEETWSLIKSPSTSTSDNSESLTPDLSSSVQSMLAMHLPLLLNEDLLLLQNAKIPIDFHDSIASTLSHIEKLKPNSNSPFLPSGKEGSNQWGILSNQFVCRTDDIQLTPRPTRKTNNCNLFLYNSNISMRNNFDRLSEKHERSNLAQTEDNDSNDDGEWELLSNKKSRTSPTTNEYSQLNYRNNKEVSDVLFHKATGSWFFSWWDEENVRRRYKYYSSKNYGEKKAKQKAVSEQQRILADKQGEGNRNEGGPMDFVSQGVNYNKRTGYWSARHKDGRSLSFNRKQFGFTGARQVAEFAKLLFEKSDQTYTREEIFELYEMEYGKLPSDNNEITEIANYVKNNFLDERDMDESIENGEDEEMNFDGQDDKMEEEFYPENENQDDEEDPEASRNQSGVIGVTFNTSKKIWSAKLTVNGITRSCNWASGKYGHEVAKQLAIVAKHEGDRMGYFPPRDAILNGYDAIQRNQKKGELYTGNKKRPLGCSDGGMSNEELEEVSLQFFSDLVMSQSNSLINNNICEPLTNEIPPPQLIAQPPISDVPVQTIQIVKDEEQQESLSRILFETQTEEPMQNNNPVITGCA